MSNEENTQNTSNFDAMRNFFGQRTGNQRADYNMMVDAFVEAFTRVEGRSTSPASKSQAFFQNKKNEMEFTQNSIQRARSSYRSSGNILDDFEKGFKDQLLNSLVGGDFKKSISNALNQFSKEFGFSIKDLPNMWGKQLGQKAFDAISKSKIGQTLGSKAKKWGNSFLDNAFKGVEGGDEAKGKIIDIAKNFFNKGQGNASNSVIQGLGKGVSKVGEAAGGKFGTIAKGAGSALSSVAGSGAGAGAGAGAAGGSAFAGAAGKALTSVISKLGPWGAIIAAIIVVITKLFGPLFKGLGEVVKALGKSFNREEEMRKKMLENAKQRLKDDIEYITKEPYEILKNAAQKWADTWDANLGKVALTQGYTKEDVYDLYSSMAERLIDEGLEKVIPATDVIEKLSSILDTGLSGRLAEEFAYEATKLNAAVPTQDFTGYASTYAQLATEAMNAGASQAEAIEYANSQLETFASNLLYSSRTLTGGFTTGLKDASSLFSEAVEIAQTAKTYNAAQISGTLTSVAAAVGSVAPDLASGLVNNIVSAAVGGNSDTLVALRSLAGVNAGNTAFLRELANNPQGVFVDIFRNLANMQTMSPDNYMEVAEGLSSVFGIDMKAFARVDFNKLADKIADMTINQASLEENMELLASGEATQTTEQLKLQEINNMILEEGLAYVIDNEAGRMIQQHMWDEQMKNDLENAQYAVDLQGAGLSFLEGIRKTITNILNFLNPIGFIAKGISNMVATAAENAGNQDDIIEILRLGSVGNNATSLQNLITRGQDLNLVTSLVEMMGGTKGNVYWNRASEYVGGLMKMVSRTSGVASGTDMVLAPFAALRRVNTGDWTSGPINNAADFNAQVDKAGGISNWMSGGMLDAMIANEERQMGNYGEFKSVYSGFTVGKTKSELLQSSPRIKTELGAITREISLSATQNAIQQSNKNMQSFLDTAEEASKTMQYEEWLKGARDYGISDFSSALKDYGRTEEEIRGYFDANQAREGAIQEVARKEDEQKFRDENREFWDYASGSNGVFQTAMWLPFLNDNFKPFFDPGARYDQRMDAVDIALTKLNSTANTISEKLGDNKEFTVISVLESINSNLISTFVNANSTFQQCLADWVRYIAATKSYNNQISSAQAWNDLKRAEGDKQNETLLALANAMNVFSAEELQKLDPQMQANALLGKIVIILEAMMQQNNNFGGFTIPDAFSSMALGLTYPTNT